MNKGQGHWTDTSIRGDYIAWLNDPIKNQVRTSHLIVINANNLLYRSYVLMFTR